VPDTPPFTVNVDVVIVDESITSENVVVIVDDIDTPVAPLEGLTEDIAGGIVSADPPPLPESPDELEEPDEPELPEEPELPPELPEESELLVVVVVVAVTGVTVTDSIIGVVDSAMFAVV
jgi:hypothetical protein